MKVYSSPSTDMLLDESRDESELAYRNRGKGFFDPRGPILILQA
jgi:hypothetical protein